MSNDSTKGYTTPIPVTATDSTATVTAKEVPATPRRSRNRRNMEAAALISTFAALAGTSPPSGDRSYRAGKGHSANPAKKAKRKAARKARRKNRK